MKRILRSAVSLLLCAAVALGGMTTEQAAQPDTPLTRGQLARLLTAFSSYRESVSAQGSTGTLFSDVNSSSAYGPYIRVAVQQSWLSGYLDGSFRPDTYITRAQAMTMINRVLNRIPEDESDLLPGMNATAEIVTESADNVLSVPNAAITRGNYVLVTKDSPSAANAEASMAAPEGYVYVKVTTGISDDDYIEVKSGLQEGDTIAYDTSTVSATDFYSNMMVSAEGGDE